MGDAVPKGETPATALPPEIADRLAELAQAFFSVENATAFYPQGHQARQAPLLRFLQSLNGLLADQDSLMLGFAEDELVWEGGFYGALPPVLKKLVDLFASQQLARITWSSGATPEEVEAFAVRLAARRGAGGRRPWDEEEQLPHIRVESVDYSGLLAEEGSGDAESRRKIRRSLLLRCFGDPEASLTPDELEQVLGQWGDPAALAGLIAEALGPGAAADPAAAVEPMRRLAGALERAGQGAEGASKPEIAARLREVAGSLPEKLRFQLIESSVDGSREDLFAQAFATPPPEELVTLLARNFAMDPAQIMRLTRVFQHLVPRRLDRMELAPLVRDQLQEGESPEDRLPENAWEEVQELLTGEAGDFMSEAYREMLRHLALREEERRAAESTFAEQAEIAVDLEPARTGGEALRIRLEQVLLATSREPFEEALTALTGMCRVALVTGEGPRGILILRWIASLRGGAEPLAGPPEAIDAALREVVTEETAAVLVPALVGAPEERALIRDLVRSSPAAFAGPLVDAMLAAREPERLREIVVLAAESRRESVSEALRRLEGAPPEEARTLVALLGELRDPAAVPGLLALLRRDHQKLRRDALRALLLLDTPEVRRALPALLADRDEEIVQIAATHLGAIGNREAAADLLRLLAGGMFAGLHAAEMKRAILALGRMRHAEAVVPLANLLRRRTWISRRAQEELGEAAAQALWRIGGEEARRALEKAASSGAPAGVAAVCKRLLARWKP